MLIDIALLPPMVQEQILTIKQHENLEVVRNGELVMSFTPNLQQQATKPNRLIGDDKAFGLWQGLGIDGLEYQEQIRSEWVREWEK